MGMPEDFSAAVLKSKTLPQRPSNEELLQLYALYKQSTDGDVSGERPGGFDFKAIAKYDAWAGRKGMSQDDARRTYVEFVEQLAKTYT